jgi:hypothetical protein
MKNNPLVTHTPIAIVITTFCLFQIAMLQTYIRLMLLSKRTVETAHAKHNQQFSGDNRQASEDLRKKIKAPGSETGTY